MYSPILHDLTSYENQIDFEKKGFCSHQWEISVPQKNCIIWSVVLSYLRSADFTVPGKIEERLSRLVSQDPGNAIDPELVTSAILGFNPFFNIHKCFFDETLKKVSMSFKKLLRSEKGQVKEAKVAQDMQLISTLLKSNILIVDLSSKNLHLVTPSDGYSTDLAAITLFCREYSNKQGKTMKRFTFSLNKDLCWELRWNACQIILESSQIRGAVEKEILPLTEKKEKKVNILITLLKKNLTHVITELYDSSYIVAKLADAGFETDPRVLDADGFSSFYYSLQSNDNNLVYILYRYAANNCYESVNTFRDGNTSIISNLSRIEKVLKEDFSKSNDFETFGEKTEPARITYRDVLRFNEFLTRVSQGINDVWKITEDSSVKKSEEQKETLKKVEKQKEIILIILENYDAFFSVGKLDLQHTSEKELIENYTKHKTYYDNLDFTAALLFFDNIFLLKCILKSPQKGLYSKLESSFLLSVVTNKYFTSNTENAIKKHDLGLDSNVNNFSIIPILERLSLREEVKNFYNILRQKKVVEEETVKCIPPQEISAMLSNFPILKDEFLISRLDRYMKTALETASEGVRQKCVTQRVLQVLGESINIEEGGPLSIRHLLRQCLPDDTVEVLKKTRNTLSHLISFQFPLKFKIEEDDSLFASMKSEIRKVREAFEKVFDLQWVRLKEFLINRGLASVQKFQQIKSLHCHPLVQPMESLGEKLRRSIAELECVLDRKGADSNCVVPNINEFCRSLMGFATSGVKKEILDQIPLEVRTRIDANQKLLQDLERGVALELDSFDHLFLEKKDLDNIKNDYKKYLESAADPSRSIRRQESKAKSNQSPKNIKSLLKKIKKANLLNTLHLIFEKRKISDSQLKVLYEEIRFSDGTVSKLNSLIEISKSPCGDNLSNLLNRIKHLYEISINEQYDIRFLWERAKSDKAKQHLVYKIVQRYFRESSFQASLEMLLFDCIGIFKKYEGQKKKRKSKNENNEDHMKTKIEDENNKAQEKNTEKENNVDQKNRYKKENNEDHMKKRSKKEDNEQMKNTEEKNNEEQKNRRYEDEHHVDQSFWLKDSYLFNGIDVRNVLAHGDPLLESIGNMLDPKDLPSELVKKMLQLLEDHECIEALCNLWQKAKQLDQSFDSSLEWCELKKSIVGCARWQEYSKLLAEDPKDSETFDYVVSFLNETASSCKRTEK